MSFGGKKYEKEKRKGGEMQNKKGRKGKEKGIQRKKNRKKIKGVK